MNKPGALDKPILVNRQPVVAAGLSFLLPGLGQLYNQSGRGKLFLAVGLMNLVLLCTVLFTDYISRALYALARRADLQPNDAFFALLRQFHTTPIMVIVILYAVAFIAFATREAYNDANLNARPLDRTSDRLFNALGTSYVAHVALILACVMVGLVSLPQKKEQEEKSVCEFILQDQNEKEKQKTKTFSTTTSAAHGKFQKEKELSNSHASAPSTEQQERWQIEKQPKIVSQNTEANENAAQQKTVSQQQQEVRPRQAKPLQQAEKQMHENRELQSQLKKIALLRKAIQPQQAIQPRRAVPQQKQQPVQRKVAHRTPPAPKPAPDFNRTHQSRRAPDIAGRSFNRREDVDDNPGAMAANADINFGPYMQQLQRRLKRNWTPPASTVARAVTVHFRIQDNGQITDLRLARSSGIGGCDRAALDAVQGASPVLPLPRGARGPVPIEFTFEYTKH